MGADVLVGVVREPAAQGLSTGSSGARPTLDGPRVGVGGGNQACRKKSGMARMVRCRAAREDDAPSG
jgi:hypothetical protein